MSRRLALGLLILVLALGPWLLVAPIAFAQEPPQPTPAASPTPAETPEGNPAPDPSGGLLGLLPDPKQWAAEVFNQVLVNLLRGLADALRKVVGAVLGSSLNFITQTPPAGSYASPTVVALWNVVRGIANAGLVLVALWGGRVYRIEYDRRGCEGERVRLLLGAAEPRAYLPDRLELHPHFELPDDSTR